MDDALEMGKASTIGSFYLFTGQVVSTVTMAVSTIILARLMLPEEYGLYAIALIPSNMMNLFRDWGINYAVTKYIAQSRAGYGHENIRDIIVAGMTFETLSGLALSLVSLGCANFMASVIFQRPESSFLISMASATIISGSLLTFSQSAFTGFEKMKPTSLIIILQAVVKSIASPLLVFIGYGVLGAVVGYTFSFLVAGIVSLVSLYLIILKRYSIAKGRKTNKSETLRKMLVYGVPLSVSSILGGFVAQFFAFMMAFYCNDTLIGNYQIAAQFAVILSLFTIPISMVLLPAFAKVDPKGDRKLIKTVFRSSVKYTAALLAPATMAVMALSKPMIGTIYGEKWAYAPLILFLYVIVNLLVVCGSLSMGSLLAGLGKTKIMLVQSLLMLFFGIPLAFILVPMFGVMGVIFGNLLAGLPGMFLGIYWVWKHYEVKADFKSSSRILIASASAAIATYLSVNFLSTAEWIKLVVGGMIFLAVYILLAPLVGAVNKSDISNLRIMLSGLGVISKVINIPLTITEKVSTRQSSKEKK
jgi:O-antigen/teichoic acid export membrane protein